METKYKALISSIEIENIFIEEVSFKRHSFPDPQKYPELSVNIASSKGKYSQSKSKLTINKNVVFKIDSKGLKNTKKTKIFELNAVFTVVYNTKEKMTDELFLIFDKKNVPINIHPYLREIIYNAMSRAGLPPVVIPVLKSFQG